MEKTAKNLSKIDSYCQDKHEKAWERSPAPNYYSGGKGWQGVQEKHPKDFDKAWAYAIAFITEREIDEQIILNDY